MARFRAYVDSAVAGARPYAFSATDAAYAWRLVGNPAYCQLAVALAEDQLTAAKREIAAGQRSASRVREDVEGRHAAGQASRG